MKKKFKDIISAPKGKSQLVLCVVLFLGICIIGGRLTVQLVQANRYVHSLYSSESTDAPQPTDVLYDAADDASAAPDNSEAPASPGATFTPLPTVEVPENMFE